MLSLMRRLERRTRPVHPDTAAALAARWAELPEQARIPAQVLGRHSAGCEGTHGVFPRCDLACTPCYHSREANRVRVDGEHTVREVEAQMRLLRERRGTGQHCQLIGGEVTLLDPEDHARALEAMRRHGRKPMSMSHGDFDYDHLLRIALGPDGRPRFRHLSFAGHFDSLMHGRRGIRRPARESELHDHRRRFVEMFERLEREHGVTHYLAHNMTVSERNLDQVAGVVEECLGMGFDMLSFQPAAYVGNPSRWTDGQRSFAPEDVWREMERGARARLPWRVFQVGDERCNRTAYGLVAGGRWVPILDDRVPADLAARDLFLDAVGGIDLDLPRPLAAVKLARLVAGRPELVPATLRWAARLAARAGVAHVARGRARSLTMVMHSFMDAREVAPAWEALQRGETAEAPAVRAAQERLQACSYAMAHPETGELVPACVQHAVLDPRENLRLMRELPLR